MSRGLQLLQSKISVLEDLSDRTDQQVKQLSLLLDEKTRQVQRQMEAAQEQIQSLDQSMQRSRDVARIFQDKIPHEEIIERQNTVKYVRAAQLAHQGLTSSEIAQQVDLPESEIELITKMNRDRLMFSSESLPDWVKEEISSGPTHATKPTALDRAKRDAFEPLPQPTTSLAQIGEEFRKAVQEFQPAAAPEEETLPDLTPVAPAPAVVAPVAAAPAATVSTRPGFQPIRPYNFPRVTKP